MDIKKIFQEWKRTAIELHFGAETGAPLPIGASKFGGRPDLPDGFQWDTFTTDTYDDDEVKPRPLAFLAQVNLADVSAYDTEQLLPETGLLSFFYELGSQRWGVFPLRPGLCAGILLSRGARRAEPDRAARRPGGRLPPAGTARFLLPAGRCAGLGGICGIQ